jgi:hypothetical protein
MNPEIYTTPDRITFIISLNKAGRYQASVTPAGTKEQSKRTGYEQVGPLKIFLDWGASLSKDFATHQVNSVVNNRAEISQLD